MRVRVLASVMGEQGLPDTDRAFLSFGQRFEDQFVHQTAARSLEESMGEGWRVLRGLPESELTRLSDEQIRKHLRDEGNA